MAVSQTPRLHAVAGHLSLAERTASGLRRAIRAEAFGQTGRLPAEPELASQLGVSRTTLRHAVAILEEEGLLNRRQGVGTFVVQGVSRLRNNLNVNFGVTDLIVDAGMRPGTVALSVRQEPADPVIATRLNRPLGTPMTMIRRTRTADGRPVTRSTDIIPTDLLVEHGVERSRVPDFVTGDDSVYRNLEAIGIVVHHAVAEVKPAEADREISAALGVPVGTLLLHLEQTDFTIEDAPIVFSHEFFIVDPLLTVQVYRKGPGLR